MHKILYTFFISFIFFYSSVLAVEIDDVNGTTQTLTCGSTVTLFDDGGAGFYSDATGNLIVTYQPDDATQYLYITLKEARIDASDELIIRELGTGNILRRFSGTIYNGESFVVPTSTAGESIVFEFNKTGSFSTQPGFELDIQCSSTPVTPNIMIEDANYTLSCGTSQTFYDDGGTNFYEDVARTYTTIFTPEFNTAYLKVTFTNTFWLNSGETLEIYDGTTLLFIFDGLQNNTPPKELGTGTAGNSLRFVFTNNGDGSTQQGWEATVECVSKAVIPNIMSNGNIVAPCNSTPYLMYDPGGAGFYDNNLDLTNVIQPESPTGYVSIKVNDMRLNFGDFLYIYQGNSTNASDLLYTFDNTLVQAPFIISSSIAGDPITLRFVTDASATLQGWEAEISCNEDIVLPNTIIDGYTYTFNCTESNTIYDPGGATGFYYDNYFGTMDYNNPYTDRFLQLDFSNLNIIAGDELRVYENGVLVPSARFSGGVNNPITGIFGGATTLDLAVGADLRIEFETNASGTNNGWEVEINSVDNTTSSVGGRRYWISNTNDNWSCNTCWSNTSGGASDGNGPPAGECEIAVFDANGSGRCTLDQNVNGSDAIYGLIMDDYAEKLDIQGGFGLQVQEFVKMNGGELEINNGLFFLNKDASNAFSITETQTQQTLIDMNGGELKVGDYDDSQSNGVHTVASLNFDDASTLDVSGGVVNISDRLIISDNSTFNLSAGDVYIKRSNTSLAGMAGAKFLLNFNANMNIIGGNLYIEGVYDATNANPAFHFQRGITTLTGGKIILGNNSGSASSYYVDGNNFDIYNLQLNLGSINDVISLAGNIGVSNQLDMTQGKINLDGQIIDLASTGELINETNDNRIFGTTGYITTTRNLATTTPGNVANLGFEINSLASPLGNTIIRRGHTQQTNPINGGFGINRYFDIIPSNNSSLNGNITIHYFDAELAGISESELNAWKQNLSTLHWEPMSGTWTDGSNANGTVNRTGQEDLEMRWTLGSYTTGALPLTLLNFTAKLNKNEVKLSWTTAQEENISEFIVEKTKDLENITTLSSVEAKGNELSVISYNLIDKEPHEGRSYYRLKIVEKDGSFTYSNFVAVEVVEDENIEIYPNPSNEQLFIEFSTNPQEWLNVEISDMLGKIVFNDKIWAEDKINVLKYGDLQSGTYILKVRTENNIWIKRIIVSE